VPTVTSACPIPTGGISSSDEFGTYYDTFASMTIASRMTGPSSCYYFVTGNINTNGYLSALGGQFGIKAVTWNQDYGRVEISATAQMTTICPSGSTLVAGILCI